MGDVLQLQFWIVPAVTLLLILVVLLGCLLWNWEDWAILPGVFAGIMVLVTLGIFLPYQSKYLVITHPSGIISTEHSSIGTDSWGNVTTVWTLQINGQEYLVYDNRAAAFHEGQRVHLSCTDQWNYGAKDQENCEVGNG